MSKLTLLNNLVAIEQPEQEKGIILTAAPFSSQLSEEIAKARTLAHGVIAHVGPGARRVKVGWLVYFHANGPCFNMKHDGASYLVLEEAMILARVEGS